MKESFYSIGQLAAIADISVQTLRYYDKIKLLKPSKVEADNSYRFYSDADILTLRIILDLKEIGFSLEEIKVYLENENSSFAISLLERKRQEFRERAASVNAILNRLEDRIDKLRVHETVTDTLLEFSKTIEIKHLPERVVAYTRYYSGSTYETLAKRFFELDTLVKNHSMKASSSRIAVYHDFLGDFHPENCDLELCLPVLQDCARQEFVRTIHGGLYATGIYKGEYKGQCTYLANWIRKRGYAITGPGVEVYINSFMNTRFPKNYVTEVQFPIKKP